MRLPSPALVPALILVAGAAAAQTRGADPTTSIMAPGAQVTPAPTEGNAGVNAAGGDSNQAIATTTANAMQPAHGANSFSQGEAQGRIANHGFQNVSSLRKDADGVWRGTATKDGQQVQVWLDYKGNVGQQ